MRRRDTAIVTGSQYLLVSSLHFIVGTPSDTPQHESLIAAQKTMLRNTSFLYNSYHFELVCMPPKAAADDSLQHISAHQFRGPHFGT